MPSQNSTYQLQTVPLGRIRQQPLRQQRDPASFAALKESIATSGLLVPPLVFPDGDQLEVFDGNGRIQACAELGIESIPVLVADRAFHEAEALEKAILTNSQRESLNPVDYARSVHRLMELKRLNVSQAAQRLGCSASAVTKLLAVLDRPAEVLDLIASRKIPLTAAYSLEKVGDPNREVELARQLASGALTRDGLSKAAKRRRKPSTSAPKSKRALVKLGPGISLTVAGHRLDFDSFIATCESALVKAKRARTQNLTFETFLKVAHDQAAAEG